MKDYSKMSTAKYVISVLGKILTDFSYPDVEGEKVDNNFFAVKLKLLG